MSGAGPSTWPAGAISAASGDAGPPQPAMPSRTPVHSNARPLARKTPPGNPFRPTADLPLGYPSQYAHDHARPEPHVSEALWIDQPSELLRRLQSAPARIGLDTEFIRERTFWPRLALVQMAVGDEVLL